MCFRNALKNDWSGTLRVKKTTFLLFSWKKIKKKDSNRMSADTSRVRDPFKNPVCVFAENPQQLPVLLKLLFYLRLFVVVGLEAADEERLTDGQSLHEGVQRLTELTAQRRNLFTFVVLALNDKQRREKSWLNLSCLEYCKRKRQKYSNKMFFLLNYFGLF